MLLLTEICVGFRKKMVWHNCQTIFFELLIFLLSHEFTNIFFGEIKMNKNTKFCFRKALIATIAVITFIFVENSSAEAQIKYNSGDRVECDSTETGKWWTKGTIMPFQKGDFGGGQEPDGSWYRFKADYNGVEYPCKPSFIRKIAGAKTENKTQENTNAQQADLPKQNEVDISADEDFLECPVEQKKVRNGAKPDAELFKKIIRCKKGEKSVEQGEEGAVKVDVAAFQIGASRPWIYGQDIEGKPGTVVYPVKATFTVKTLYRNATEVEENAIRILNFFVNSLGEWQIGSEELVKSAKFRRLPKN